MKPVNLDHIEDENLRRQIEEKTGNGKKRNKYGARRVEYNGVVYDSKKEAGFARMLDILKGSPELKHKVVSYKTQIRYDLIANGISCGFYKLDFEVHYADGRVRHVDVKGYKKGCAYQMFRLKKKIVEAIYGIKIEEV